LAFDVNGVLTVVLTWQGPVILNTVPTNAVYRHVFCQNGCDLIYEAYRLGLAQFCILAAIPGLPLHYWSNRRAKRAARLEKCLPVWV
jgi:hypothetical protein